MDQEEHQQHQQQRGGNRERRHHRMQQQLMFETPPPIAYGYVDTSWEAHVTILHHLQQHQRYVTILLHLVCLFTLWQANGAVQTGIRSFSFFVSSTKPKIGRRASIDGAT